MTSPETMNIPKRPVTFGQPYTSPRGERFVCANSSHNTLRVALISRAPFHGGAEQSLYQLARTLQTMGHEVHVWLGHQAQTADKLRAAHIAHTITPTPNRDKFHWFSYRSARRQLRDSLRQFNPDVIHANDLPTAQIMADAAAGLGIPRLVHHRFHYEQGIAWFLKPGVERHIFISRAIREQLCEACPSLAYENQATIYNGLELDNPPNPDDKAQQRRSLGLSNTRTLIGFSGQVIARKGVDVLLCAFSRLNPAIQRNSELIIVGDDLADDGAYRMTMQALAEKLNVPARFVGFQDDPAKYIRLCDIAVVPSRAEPLGRVVLEAMNVGVPVIASAVGGIPEMVTHGHTGLLVEPDQPDDLAQKLDILIEDAPLRQQLSQAALAMVRERFSIEQHTHSIIEQYRISIDKMHGRMQGAGA